MKRKIAIVLVLAMILTVCPQAATAVRNPAASDYDFSIMWISDTQYMAQDYPKILASMGKWIADNAAAKKTQYIIHTGDLVEKGGDEAHWKNVNTQLMKYIEDTKIPFSVLPGNHDMPLYSKYWGEEKFKDKSYYGGSYLNNFGHYDLLTLGGVDFVFVSMGYNDSGYTQGAVDWMNEVFAKYPDRVGVIQTHFYLIPLNPKVKNESDGVVAKSAPGTDLFEKVVKKNPNVQLVLCGHRDGAGMLVDKVDDNGDGTPDRDVIALLMDYQEDENGGNGYFRTMYFNVKQGTVTVNTYSPYTKEYILYKNKPELDEFVFNLDFPEVEEPGDPNVIKVRLNGKRLAFDQDPIAESGRTLVPLRAIFEAFGAEVSWDQATQSVTAVKGDTTIKLTLGSTAAYKNGTLITLDVPAKALNGRTLVPVRFIGESFGAEVGWDQATKTVIITYQG